jgi:hypothetical protein
MRRRYLLVSALLLVYPALLLYGGYVPGVLLMLLFLAPAIVGLRRGMGWAHGAALAISLGLAVIIVVYGFLTVAAFTLGAAGWIGPEPWYLEVGPHIALELLAGAACGAAFALLLRDGAHVVVRRRVLAAVLLAFCAEVVLMALIFRFGVGAHFFFGGRTLPQGLLNLSQAPGHFILSSVMGISGYLSDWGDPQRGGITLDNMPLLIAANTFGLLPLTVFLLARLDARRASVRTRTAS